MPNLHQEFVRSLKNEKLVAFCTVIVGPQLGRKMLIWPDGQTKGDLGHLAIDNWAHAGGFGGGYLMARWLDPLQPERTDHQIAALLCIGLTILSVVASLVEVSIHPEKYPFMY